MFHVSHPSADSLMRACATSDWAKASRHWRTLPPFARDSMSSPALFCAVTAIKESLSTQRMLADDSLRPLCSALGPHAQRSFSNDMARSLALDLCSIGLWQCFCECARLIEHGEPMFEACFSNWLSHLFPSDAKGFLNRISPSEHRGALDALGIILTWQSNPQSSPLLNGLKHCEKASLRFWPDDRDELAKRSMLSIQEFLSTKESIPIDTPSL